MPFVLNSLPRDVSVCAQGNWFTFKPKQIKNIASENLALFLTSNCAIEGLVRVSDLFEDPAYKATPEGKKDFEECEAKGMAMRCQFLQGVINNEFVSRKRDMARVNDNSDVKTDISKGMIANMEELASYKKLQQASKNEQVQKIAELEKLIND